MILNLNKDFFLGAIIWYFMIGNIFGVMCGIIGSEREKTYSIPDCLIMATLCLGWVIA